MSPIVSTSKLFPSYSLYKLFKFQRKTTSFSFSTTTTASMNTPSGLSVNSVTDALKLSLEDLNWDHSFVRELPGDPRTDFMQRQLLTTS
ncbi:hypothetical protein HanOQP8_Chr02g0082471 [Helianthus annuus]|nr:hypothetical protein HanOQP8_Chr02g0082471 [Helianthus annuus]